MGETSKISWTDATFNPWIGCTKVSPACDHCYAERDNIRRGWVPGWGNGINRRRTSDQNWSNPIRWDRMSEKNGRPLRVFCASLADVFDNEVPETWRFDLFNLIVRTTNLRWMILTKRVGNVRNMVPISWLTGCWPRHVGIMATIVNQIEWDRDYPKLSALPAPWHGVSMEPLLGYICIGASTPDWIITGGESGPIRRDLDLGAVRSIRDQCASNGVAFHHKQNGGLRGGGCLIDGVEYKEFPNVLL